MATYFPQAFQLPQPIVAPQIGLPQQRRRRRRPAPQRRRRNGNNQQPQANQLAGQITKLTQQVQKLVLPKQPKGVTTLGILPGEPRMVFLLKPEQDNDPRRNISRTPFNQLLRDINRQLRAGAGAITLAPGGKITVHLQFDSAQISEMPSQQAVHVPTIVGQSSA